MISGGSEVDIATGLPIDPPRVDIRKEREEKRRRLATSRYEDLLNDLSGNGGEVLRLISSLFIDRINTLIKEDPVCSEYQKIFDNIGIKINAGRKLVSYMISGIEDNIPKSM
jgi:hypothetical protein